MKNCIILVCLMATHLCAMEDGCMASPTSELCADFLYTLPSDALPSFATDMVQYGNKSKKRKRTDDDQVVCKKKRWHVPCYVCNAYIKRSNYDLLIGFQEHIYNLHVDSADPSQQSCQLLLRDVERCCKSGCKTSIACNMPGCKTMFAVAQIAYLKRSIKRHFSGGHYVFDRNLEQYVHDNKSLAE